MYLRRIAMHRLYIKFLKEYIYLREDNAPCYPMVKMKALRHVFTRKLLARFSRKLKSILTGL